MARDRVLGLVSRAQVIAANDVGNARLARITEALEEAARENVLAPLVAATNAAQVWEEMDLARKRAVIWTLMTITLRSPGRGARRAFDPNTVEVDWNMRGGEPEQSAS
jgi:site-specific DNA recombinase